MSTSKGARLAQVVVATRLGWPMDDPLLERIAEDVVAEYEVDDTVVLAKVHDFARRAKCLDIQDAFAMLAT